MSEICIDCFNEEEAKEKYRYFRVLTPLNCILSDDIEQCETCGRLVPVLLSLRRPSLIRAIKQSKMYREKRG